MLAEYGAVVEPSGATHAKIGSREFVIFRNKGTLDSIARACAAPLKVAGTLFTVVALRESCEIELVVRSGDLPKISPTDICTAVDDTEGIALRPGSQANVYVAADAASASLLCAPSWQMPLSGGACILGFVPRWEVDSREDVVSAGSDPSAAQPTGHAYQQPITSMPVDALAQTGVPAAPPSASREPAHHVAISAPLSSSSSVAAFPLPAQVGVSPLMPLDSSNQQYTSIVPPMSLAQAALCRLSVRSLHFSVSLDDLYSLLSAGGIVSVLALGPVVRGPSALQRSAFVEYAKAESAESALRTLAGMRWMGTQLLLERLPASALFPPPDHGPFTMRFPDGVDECSRRRLVLSGLPALTTVTALQVVLGAVAGAELTSLALGPARSDVGGLRTAYLEYASLSAANAARTSLFGREFFGVRLRAESPNATQAIWPPLEDGPFTCAKLAATTKSGVSPLSTTSISAPAVQNSHAQVPGTECDYNEDPRKSVSSRDFDKDEDTDNEDEEDEEVSGDRSMGDDKRRQADSTLARVLIRGLHPNTSLAELISHLTKFGPLSKVSLCATGSDGSRWAYVTFFQSGDAQSAITELSTIKNRGRRWHAVSVVTDGTPFPRSKVAAKCETIDFQSPESGPLPLTAVRAKPAREVTMTKASSHDDDEFARRFKLSLVPSGISTMELYKYVSSFGRLEMMAVGPLRGSHRTVYCRYASASDAAAAFASSHVGAFPGHRDPKCELNDASSFGRPFPSHHAGLYTLVDLTKMAADACDEDVEQAGGPTQPKEECRILLWLNSPRLTFEDLREPLKSFGPIVSLAIRAKHHENKAFVTYKYASSATRAVKTGVRVNGVLLKPSLLDKKKWGNTPFPPQNAVVDSGINATAPRIVRVIKRSQIAPVAEHGLHSGAAFDALQPPRYSSNLGSSLDQSDDIIDDGAKPFEPNSDAEPFTVDASAALAGSKRRRSPTSPPSEIAH